MTPMSSPRVQRGWASAIAAVLGVLLAGLAGPALAAPAASAIPVSAQSASGAARALATRSAARSEDGVRWQALTATQREALAPLESEWPRIEAARKQKWLVLADRFKGMPPEERARINARMAEWARLTPAERGQARLRFQETKDLPPSDRKERWQAYQALPADAKEKLAARAASASASGAKTLDARRADAAGRPGASAASTQAKSNTVPNPALAQPSRAVAPTLVQAAPGATTTSITRRPMPPTHQQSGMPKIATTPEFVSRATLLPRRGPQAAGIASAPFQRPSVVPVRGAASAPRAGAPASAAASIASALPGPP